MSSFYRIPMASHDMPKEAMTDLYRAKHGLPLDGESHERFIATKVPYRKNKDYRPRFRNYSFGYPVNILKIKQIFFITNEITSFPPFRHTKKTTTLDTGTISLTLWQILTPHY
jgi:hypothetical protein